METTVLHCCFKWNVEMERRTSCRIEIEQCARCGGRLEVIASIEEPELIERILAHRRERGEDTAPTASLGARGPPQASLL
jgi:Zn-finger nucleic acid-binding protein